MAEREQEKLAKLLRHSDRYIMECGVVPLQLELGTFVVASEEQMKVCHVLVVGTKLLLMVVV